MRLLKEVQKISREAEINQLRRKLEVTNPSDTIIR